jgi:hypothetical protein
LVHRFHYLQKNPAAKVTENLQKKDWSQFLALNAPVVALAAVG